MSNKHTILVLNFIGLFLKTYKINVFINLKQNFVKFRYKHIYKIKTIISINDAKIRQITENDFHLF